MISRDLVSIPSGSLAEPFTLRQSLVACRQCQLLIAECDREIHQALETLPSKPNAIETSLPPAKAGTKGDPAYNLRAQYYRIGLCANLLARVTNRCAPLRGRF